MAGASSDPDGLTLRRHVELAISRGWFVFPLEGKQPFPGSAGYLDATCDVDDVDWFWGHDNPPNYGVACGRSGLVVIDVDVDAGGDLTYRRLVADGVLFPTTYTVQTGRGFHLYYEASKAFTLTNTASKLPGVGDTPFIDVRADGGYVVGAGSTHPNGSRYDFMYRPDHPVAALPPFIEPDRNPDSGSGDAPSTATDRTTIVANCDPFEKKEYSDRLEMTSNQKLYVEAAARAGINEIATAANGVRNATLFKQTARLTRFAVEGWFTTSQLYDWAFEASQQAGLEEQEATRTIKSALKRGVI